MRRSIAFSFIGFLIVLISTVIIILFAYGYDYNFLAQRFEKTGAIKISSTPSSATVLLNGKNVGTSPYSGFYLPIGVYSVELTYPGFRNWVSMEKVALGNIDLITPVLVPNFLDFQTINLGYNEISGIFLGNNSVAFVTNSQNTQNLYVHNFSSNFLGIGESTLQISGISTLGADPSYYISSVNFSSNDSNLLMHLKSNKTMPDKYFVASANNSFVPIDISQMLNPLEFTSVEWSKSENVLLLSNSTQIVTLNINTGQTILIAQVEPGNIIKNFSYTSQYMIYSVEYSKNEYVLYSIQMDGTQKHLIKQFTQPILSTLANDNFYAFSIKNLGISIYKDITATSFLQIGNTQTTQLLLLSPSPDSETLLYKDQSNELYTYSIKNQTISNLNINTNNILNIIWDKNSQVLFYLSRQSKSFQIHTISIDGNNNYNLYSNNSLSPQLFISPFSNELMYVLQTPDLYYKLNYISYDGI